MDRVIVNGRAKELQGYDRGRMLVRPEEEWRRRALPHLASKANGAFLDMLRVLLAFWLFFGPLLVYAVVEAQLPAFGVAMVIVGWCSMVALAWYLRRSMLDVPTPGLYERGWQGLGDEFLPFTEMLDVELVRMEGQVVGVELTCKANGSDHVVQWSGETLALLGEDGVEELERRVCARAGPGSA